MRIHECILTRKRVTCNSLECRYILYFSMQITYNSNTSVVFARLILTMCNCNSREQFKVHLYAFSRV